MNNDMNNYVTGPAYVLGYCFLGASIDVLLSGLLQSTNLFVLLFWSFLFTWLGFCLISYFFSPIHYKACFKHYKTITLTNLSTLGSWVGLFIGLKWIEPSILIAIIFGLGPIFSVIFEMYNKNTVESRSKVISILLFFVVLILLFMAINNPRSNPFDSDLTFFLVLSLVCVTTSICLASYTYISKSLSEKEFSAVNIQSLRFPLLIFVCFLFLPSEALVINIQANFWIFLPVIVILGNIIPLWMLQKGIETTRALTTNIIINISPCITLFLELFDPAIEFSYLKLIVLILLLLLMMMTNDSVYNFFIRKIKTSINSKVRSTNVP